MKFQVRVMVSGEVVKEDVIEIEDDKLEPLSQDEIEASVEIVIRDWADRNIEIGWQAVEELESEED